MTVNTWRTSSVVKVYRCKSTSSRSWPSTYLWVRLEMPHAPAPPTFSDSSHSVAASGLPVRIIETRPVLPSVDLPTLHEAAPCIVLRTSLSMGQHADRRSEEHTS